MSPITLNEQSPDVSVIIPTYNRISMLKEALNSVVSQEFDGVFEIIVIDDNSKDGTSEIVSQEYPSVHLISLKQNVGAYVARNMALAKAKGKYIALLDSDDFWEKNYLKTQIEALEGKERCFCVSSLVTWNTLEDQKRIDLQRPDLKNYSSPFHHLLVRGSFIFTPSSAVFPRQVFDDVGVFDETYRIGGDTDLYIRCLLMGYQPIYNDLPVAIRRIHGKGQATDNKNIEIRRKSRFERAVKYRPLIEKHCDIISIRQIYAEINTVFAGYYFEDNNWQGWLRLHIDTAVNGSPGYALSSLTHDIRCVLKIGTRLKTMHYSIKNWLHSVRFSRS